MFVSPTVTTVQALAPLRSDPAHGAVLLDVDGTLAPIVERAEDARVPEATRSVLIELTKHYGLVACVSGRRAQEARQIVAIGSIAYVGNHGGELLAPGATVTRLLDPALRGWGERVAHFVAEACAGPLRGMRVRQELKGPVVALHWRGASDEAAAAAALGEVAHSAEAAGLAVHWGRKVLEVRPPVTLNKGLGIAALFADVSGDSPAGGVPPGDGVRIRTAIYIGDDRTDLDAFAQLRAMVAAGTLDSALCVAVASDEGPSELVQQADVRLDGDASVRQLLAALL